MQLSPKLEKKCNRQIHMYFGWPPSSIIVHSFLDANGYKWYARTFDLRVVLRVIAGRNRYHSNICKDIQSQLHRKNPWFYLLYVGNLTKKQENWKLKIHLEYKKTALLAFISSDKTPSLEQFQDFRFVDMLFMEWDKLQVHSGKKELR